MTTPQVTPPDQILLKEYDEGIFVARPQARQ